MPSCRVGMSIRQGAFNDKMTRCLYCDRQHKDHFHDPSYCIDICQLNTMGRELYSYTIYFYLFSKIRRNRPLYFQISIFKEHLFRPCATLGLRPSVGTHQAGYTPCERGELRISFRLHFLVCRTPNHCVVWKPFHSKTTKWFLSGNNHLLKLIRASASYTSASAVGAPQFFLLLHAYPPPSVRKLWKTSRLLPTGLAFHTTTCVCTLPWRGSSHLCEYD